MAKLMNCSYCAGEVTDDHVCRHCKDVLLEYAEKGQRPPYREKVAEESREKAHAEIRENLRKQQEALQNICPTCGKPRDTTKYC